MRNNGKRTHARQGNGTGTEGVHGASAEDVHYLVIDKNKTNLPYDPPEKAFFSYSIVQVPAIIAVRATTTVDLTPPGASRKKW